MTGSERPLAEQTSEQSPRARWRKHSFWQAALGSVLLFAALPPLGISFLGWVAPVPWILLIRRDRLPRKRPYRSIWLAGVLFWLLAAHWLRLPHPATTVGWIAAACYLGLYLPGFVLLSRVAVHRLKVPVWLAAAVVWTGLELLRAHMLTGFLMASLAHTQLHWPVLLQVADLGGEYMVDFVVIVVAACLAEALAESRGRKDQPGINDKAKSRPRQKLGGKRTRRNPYYQKLAPGGVLLAATLGYGQWRLVQGAPQLGPRVALIQGNALADWKADPRRAEQIMQDYTRLSVKAISESQRRQDGRAVELVVWPETMFRGTIISFDKDYEPPHGQSKDDLLDRAQAGPASVASLVSLLKTAVLLGVDVVRFAAKATPQTRAYQSWNSAVLADRTGTIVGRYDKVHLVLFGEYIPLAKYLPWLYRLTPLTGGVTAGAGPAALPSQGVVYTANICYESVLPHVIRRQVIQLARAGSPPDVLVNLTNDAWYWGSSELDMHLACDVLRAIENRKPHLVAANGGISAHIDSCGRIIQQSPRQVPDFILADVRLDSRMSVYTRIGDWPAGVCLACCGFLAIVAARGKRIGRGPPLLPASGRQVATPNSGR